MNNRINRLVPVILSMTVGSASVMAGGLPVWNEIPGAGTAGLDNGVLRIELAAAGEIGFKRSPIAVKPNARVSLVFAYTSENLSAETPLIAGLRWLDAQGQDIDEHRHALGFPPLARDWRLHTDRVEPRRVADTVSVPSAATAVEISLRLERSGAGRAVKVAISDVELNEGEVEPAGVETPLSGTDDAGPLSTPPPGVAFGENLVSNATFNDGEEVPEGWRIEGDNSGGAARWQSGGAFSGRRCLKVNDRGPTIRSWGEQKPSVYVPGGSPGGNYANAREEASARWVSEPSPATPGAVYQTTAFLWYANRHRRDRGNVNPVRIQFLDKGGNVLPYHNVWQDWLPNSLPFEQTGWVRVLGNPVVAPENAVSVRVAVVMFHAFYDMEQAVLGKRSDDRGFVLVDNIALYRVLSERKLWQRNNTLPLDPEDAFLDTVKAGGLPFVPTSTAHRPDTLTTQSETQYAGGILFAPTNSVAQPLNLRIRNWIGDIRNIEVDCEIEDWLGRKVLEETLSISLPPFGSETSAVAHPGDLPLGAYTIRYVIREAGVVQDQGLTRFAVLARRETTPAERGRKDYPFSLWTPWFRTNIGQPEEAFMGQLFDAAGMGKTWFGCHGPIYLGHFVNIKDAEARRQAVEARIEQAREGIAAWRRYGVTPMGHLEMDVLPEDKHPILGEVVTQLVTALKDDIRFWRWGTEAMHGGVRELDRATREDGSIYLIWGARGTVRQYWETYRVGYEAAKAVDPECLFGPQVASDIGGNVLRLFFQVRTPEQIDMFGMNTYNSAYSIWPPNIVELGKAGVSDLPIFVSEFDVRGRAPNSGPARLKEEQDAVRRMVIYWTSVLSSFPTFFHLEQYVMGWNGNSEASPLHLNRVRPQFAAYATMTEMLGAGRFVAAHELPGAMIHVRERSARPGLVAVMWSNESGTEVELEVGAERVTLVDVMGNRRELATPGGLATLPLTPMPQYLLGAAVVRPAPTVRLEIEHATRDPQRPQIRVSIVNDRRDRLSGRLVLEPESALALTPPGYEVEALAPGEHRSYEFEVRPVDPERDARLPVRAVFHAGDRRFEAVGTLNYHFVTRVSKPPTIDGDLGDWPEDFPLVADRSDQFWLNNSPKPWGGADDLSARLWLQWDDKHLYLAAKVVDDVAAFPDTPGSEFTKDCIELLIDVNRTLRADGGLQMFTLAGYEDGQPRVRRLDGVLMQGEVETAQLAVRRDGKATLYEAAIPWEDIAPGFRPESGRAISIACTVNDHDGGDSGRRGISWFGLVSNKNPAEFGDVVLTDESAEAGEGAAPVSLERPENLLPNGDFNDPELPPGANLEGWRLWIPSDLDEPNARASLVTEGAFSGRSLRIERLHPRGIMSVGGWSIPVQPGEVYLFRAMAKADEREVTVWLNPSGADKKQISPVWVRPLSVGTETHHDRGLVLNVARLADRSQYHPVAGVFEIPVDAEGLNISFAYNWAPGAAWIDACELYRLRKGM